MGMGMGMGMGTGRAHAAYVVPAGMYGCQVWSSAFLKDTLCVKRSAHYWAVLRECAQEPLQFYCFRAAIRFLQRVVVL